MQLSPKLVEQIRLAARAVPRVDRVWLFGSRARDEAAPRADVDLAVECPAATPGDFGRFMLRMSELDSLLPVDIVRVDESGEELTRRIRRDGVLLYER